MPTDPIKKARTRSWMFSALNTIEPHMMNLSLTDLFYPEEEWAKQGRPIMVKSLEERLDQLATWLKEREFLEDQFTAADLLMITVLRNCRHTDIILKNKILQEYVDRGEARPPFKRALEAQMAPFLKSVL